MAIKKQIFLENLPKGGGYGINPTNINWGKSNNKMVHFIYDDVKGDIEIIGYEKEKHSLSIIYNNNSYNITTSSFLSCNLGRIVGKYTKDFKIEIGTTFKDDKRDITIIDREYRIEYDKNNQKHNMKYYKYHCNTCTWDEGWSTEYNILKGYGCSCCNSDVIVLGINTIWDTDKWMIPYINDDEFCKTHTHGCGDVIYPTCPDCGRNNLKKMRVCDIYVEHSIRCSCGDNIPYPEKFMFNMLKQLRVDSQTQLNKTTFKWCDKYKYDFYISNMDIIIETHGLQHYEEKGWKTSKSLKEEKKNDKIKKQLALKNDIKEESYIVIDCRKSESDWIKNNILESNLAKVFDLSNIDWNKCHEYACSNLVKVACEYKRDNPNMTTTDISKLINLSSPTIIKYLKQGAEIWDWIDYDGKEEQRKTCGKNGKSLGKQVEVFKDSLSLGIFESCAELERQSEKLFGVKLFQGHISAVCCGKKSQYKEFTFKYVN